MLSGCHGKRDRFGEDPDLHRPQPTQTALLEFKLVRSPEEQRALFQRLDSWLASRGASAGGDTALAKTPLTGLMIDAGFFRMSPREAAALTAVLAYRFSGQMPITTASRICTLGTA